MSGTVRVQFDAMGPMGVFFAPPREMSQGRVQVVRVTDDAPLVDGRCPVSAGMLLSGVVLPDGGRAGDTVLPVEDLSRKLDPLRDPRVVRTPEREVGAGSAARFEDMFERGKLVWCRSQLWSGEFLHHCLVTRVALLHFVRWHERDLFA